MNQDMGIQISSGGGFVRVVVVAGVPPENCATVFLTAIQARELARLIRNAADFTAAAGPAQGSA
ncbi:MAG: hypothetical protein INF84_04350 [Roseomonas sp.]|jgi:hypothetical protein|nr:hypothetical protein [Roseomonas sp.]